MRLRISRDDLFDDRGNAGDLMAGSELRGRLDERLHDRLDVERLPNHAPDHRVVEAPHLTVHHRRGDDHGGPRMKRVDVLDQLEAAASRHHQIDHDDVVDRRVQLLHRLAAIPRSIGIEARAKCEARQQMSDRPIIVDDEQPLFRVLHVCKECKAYARRKVFSGRGLKLNRPPGCPVRSVTDEQQFCNPKGRVDQPRPTPAFADELAQSEAQLRLIVDSIRDYAIYLLGIDGRIETWSRGAQRIKGYTADEVIGRNFEIFYPPEDVEAGKPRRQLEIAAERGTYEDESVHVRKDGSRFWAAVVVSAIRNPGGELRGFVNLPHDVTERRRQRERLAFIAEASRVLATSLDYEETLTRIAKIAVPRIADWCTIDLLSDDGQTISRVTVEHEDPAKVELAKGLQKKFPPSPGDPGIANAIRERRAIFYPDISEDVLRERGIDDERRLRLIHELRLRSAIIAPLIAGDRVLGTLTLVTAGDRRLMTDDVTVAEDVASRAAIAVQNAQLYREAQEANRAKDDFLAAGPHELRTPMTAVLGWAKLLRTDTDPAIIAEAALAIERSAAAQAQLIDDILDVARIRVGKLRMRFDETNLAEVVERAVDMVRLPAEAKHIDLRLELDRRVVRVPGDAQRLHQATWTLLSNAVKFTPEGGRVSVLLAKNGTAARLTVSDTGPGIPPEFLPHLFERFRQAETKQTRGHGGLGLGLSIAQHIVSAHHGSIPAESAGGGEGGA